MLARREGFPQVLPRTARTGVRGVLEGHVRALEALPLGPGYGPPTRRGGDVQPRPRGL